MTAPAPLADTQRIVDWEELPPRARAIPNDFNPMEAGVLMQHQADWIDLTEEAKIAVCEKGRRTGITFATAMNDTIIAATDRAEGGDDIWYMADTREKGLEYIGYCAKFSRVIARGQATAIEQFIFEDQQPDGSSKNITGYRIRYGSGNRITALASRPENVHGLQGIVNLDEAALHRDVSSTLESATALLAWGGRIRVWSTHRGTNNPFNQLVKDVKKGLYGSSSKCIRITFDDAVENGLYERVCFIKGKKATLKGKRQWYTEFRSSYGPRTAAMREELDVIPRDGAGASIPGIWIENAMPEKRPVLRITCNDDFAKLDEETRKRWGEDWIKTHLNPVLESLIKRDRYYAVGMDFARHRHFSVIMPAEITPLLHRHCPFLIEMANVPTRQQEQVLWALLDYLKRWTFAGDASGPGQTLMEYTGDKFGRADPKEPKKGGRVHEIKLSRKWYAEWMKPWIDSFEDGTATYPRDESLEADFRAVEDIDGIPMVPKADRKDLKEPELYRHGDGAIASALMWYASLHKSSLIEWTPVPDKSSRWDGVDDDSDINMQSGGGW
ncbi:MAG: hypothetical protein RPT95_10330 [Candidatus Sedimenticola sp. (ex Thyasira tokunagai)]